MKILDFNKKGALNLSINAIVVLIIAIVFLGLALTFTRNLIGQSTEKLRVGIDNVDLSTPPDADHPIVVDGELSVKSGGTKHVNIGFYNSESDQVTEVYPDFEICSPGSDVPTVEALNETVDGNSPTAFTVSIKPGSMSSNTYICKLRITDGTDTHANMQVTFTVTS